eukprot:2566658-Pleurochrysis_carterae.AAC.1
MAAARPMACTAAALALLMHGGGIAAASAVRPVSPALKLAAVASSAALARRGPACMQIDCVLPYLRATASAHKLAEARGLLPLQQGLTRLSQKSRPPRVRARAPVLSEQWPSIGGGSGAHRMAGR